MPGEQADAHALPFPDASFDTAVCTFSLCAIPDERRSLGIASHWPFDQWGRFLPEHTTAVSLLDRLLHHANVVVTCGTQSCS